MPNILIKNNKVVNAAMLTETLNKIKNNALNEIEKCNSTKNLLKLKSNILGRKSELTLALKQISAEADPAAKKELGQLANNLKNCLNEAFKTRLEGLQLKEQQEQMKNEKVDVTMPGRNFRLGRLHPLTQVLNEINSIFVSMGYSIVEGPEIETDYYNFEALNIPKNHPARDTQDTFYLKTKNLLLRTQTSGVQVHVMENTKPPVRIISPGRVFRSDSVDATHSPIFHQLEGLCVDKKVSMANLKHALQTFVRSFYGPNVKTRFRPHHFPFTEPSAEMDISCFACDGNGCSLCKNEGYIEILGCGMVHCDVLKRCNIDPDVYTGFAFGFGIERIAMLRHKIDDLRMFYRNNLDFLCQF